MKVPTGKLYKRVSQFTLFFALVVSGLSVAVPLYLSQVAHATSDVVYINNLQPDWSAPGGGGVYSAYYGWLSQDDYSTPVTSPGSTATYLGKQAGIIKAGQNNLNWDEGLFGFKPTGTINDFAIEPLSYDVVNQTGVNPVWMTIEIDTGVVGDRGDNTNYQYVPTTNPAGWHTVNAATGQWQQMDDNGNGTGPLMTLGEVATANSGKDVVRAYLRLGMGSSYTNGGTGTTAWVDKATIGGVTYDFVLAAPSVTITSPTPNQTINGRTVTIKGTATDTDFNYYYCYVEDSHGEVGARDAACTTTWHAVNTVGTLGTVVLPSDLPDGNYVAHLVAYDKDHNVAEVTQPFVLDNTAPTTPTISYPTDNSFVANIQKVTWNTVTDNFANPVTYIYQSSTDSGTNTDGSFISPAYTSSNLNDAQISTLGTPDNIYYLHVKAVDSAGNMSTWSTTMKVTVDSTAPVATITTPTIDAVSGHILNIEGTATDANFNYYYCYVTNASGEVGIRDPQCITAWSAGSPFHSAFAATVTGTTFGHLGTVDLTGLSSGAYQVHLIAYDKAGNSTETTQQFMLDNTPPNVTYNAADNKVAGNKVTPDITVTDPNTPYGISWEADSANPFGATYDNSLLNPTFTFSNYGNYKYTLTVTDALGNTSIPKDVILSYTAPLIQLTSPVPAPARTITPTTTTTTTTPQTTDTTANTDGTVADTTGQVLGDQTTKPNTDNKGTVKGDSTTKNTDNTWSFLGLAWYWWLLIVAAIVAVWWFIAARRRVNQNI